MAKHLKNLDNDKRSVRNKALSYKQKNKNKKKGRTTKKKKFQSHESFSYTLSFLFPRFFLSLYK